MTSSLGQTAVDTSDRSFRTLDLTKVHGLKQTWFGPQDGCVADTTGGWDDLTASSVNSISVQSDIVNVNPDSSHVLFAQDSLVSCPLEAGDN